MTTEETKQLKVGDRIRVPRIKYWWEVQSVEDRGVVVTIDPKESKNPHKHFLDWNELLYREKLT